MKQAIRNAAAVALGLACAGPALAGEGDAGVRTFPVTLTIDDVDVTDEATLPLASWQRQGAQGGPGPTDAFAFAGEFDKRIADGIGLGVADALLLRSTAHGKTRAGASDVSLSLKYEAYVSPEREFLLSIGLVREFGRTGATHLGADGSGYTAPAIYAGKGFPEAASPLLRPFAVTGTLDYAVYDRGLKLGGGRPGDGAANRIAGGLSVQYSLPYLHARRGGDDDADFVDHLVPLVEVAFSSPVTRPSGLGAQAVFAPGVIWSADTFQIGIEALIPANAASGTHVGAIAQLHVFFEDLYPDSLGKPLLAF